MQSAGPAGYLAAEWRTFVPVSLDYFKLYSPLSECFVPRHEEGARYRKVSLPGRLAKTVETTAGNHGIRSLTGASLQEHLAESYYLAHFPVRSAEQLIVKNVIATHNLAARVDAEDGEGNHVLPVLQTIRRKGYRLALQDLVALAYGYASEGPVPTPEVVSAADRDPRFETILKYRDLAEIDVLGRLDAELQRYAGELKRARKGARALKLEAVRLQFHLSRRLFHRHAEDSDVAVAVAFLVEVVEEDEVELVLLPSAPARRTHRYSARRSARGCVD